jgi:hypothetical protein
MILIIGLIILAVAALLAILGVATNGGSSHLVNGDFALFGQHITGLSTGQLYLFGIIVGLVAALGLSVLRGFFVRGLASRDLQKELKRSHAETSTLRSDFERLQKELAAERAQNLSHSINQAPTNEQTPPSNQ